MDNDTFTPFYFAPSQIVGGNPLQYAQGLKPNDPTFDNGPILVALANALFPGGGTIRIPRGDYWHQSRINISTFARDVIFQGEGGLSAGATAATRIIYNGPNFQNAWGCISTTGCKWENLQMLYTSNLEGVNFIDWTGSAYNTMNDVLISGFGNKTALGLVNLNFAELFRFNRVSSQGAHSGYRGKFTNSSVSNVGTWTDCYFNNFLGPPIVNPGEQWTFFNPTVESLSISEAGGKAGFALCLAGFTCKAFNIFGGWLGDVTQPANGGNWLQLSGDGIHVLGTQVGGGDTLLRAGDNGPTKDVNISAHFDHTRRTVISVSPESSGWFILPISADHGTLGLEVSAGAGLPDRSIIVNPGGTVIQSGMMPEHPGVIDDGSFAETPPDMTYAYDSIHNKLYVKSGGVWRSSPEFT